MPRHATSGRKGARRTSDRPAGTSRSGKLALVAGRRGGRQLRLRQQLGFTRPQFARLVPISERSLAEIENGKPPGEATSRSLTQLQRLVAALEEVMERRSTGTWLAAPNEAFDGLKPMEVIERGETDRIWSMIYQLRSGAPF